MNAMRFVNILEVDPSIQEKVRVWRNKDEVKNWMFNQGIISVEDHQKWLKALAVRNDREFWVVFVGEIPVGAAYLHDMDHDHKISEWGFYIGEGAYKGRGLGKHILYKLLVEFFDVKRFTMLRTKVFSANEAAIHLYRKFFFQEKERFLDNGTKVCIFEFTQALWQKFKAKIGELLNV